MRSAQLGKSISEVEVTNISKHGFWLLLRGREFFLPFQEFPWFLDVPVGQLLNVELPHPHHLHWPDLDVDLAVESIEHPERFPLVSQKRPNQVIQPTRRRKQRRAAEAETFAPPAAVRTPELAGGSPAAPLVRTTGGANQSFDRTNLRR